MSTGAVGGTARGDAPAPAVGQRPARAGEAAQDATITPIILIGMNRSGTKWLSNIILSHDAVIGVQSPRFGGILESEMLGPMRDKFDPAFPEEYIALVELWSRTEFFRLAGFDKDAFYRLDPRPRSVLELFGLAMNELARRNGCRYWLQKTSPINAHAVLAAFPQAKIVITRRDLLDNVRSNLALQARYRKPRPLLATWRYVYQDKLLDAIARRYPVIRMRYEDLRAHPEREKARLFAELGLEPPADGPEPAFPRNTSFASDRQREQVLDPRQRALVRSFALLLKLVPLPVISVASGVRRAWAGCRPRPFFPDSFGELGDRLADRSRGSGESR
jgi:hypothetical protein